MTKISSFFYRISTGWVSLVALIIFIVFTATVLPDQAEKAEQAAQGADTPDISLRYYSAQTLYTWAEAYGEDGRQEYVRARFTFDLAWPLVYTFFLVSATSWLYQRILPQGSPWRLVNLVPLAAMLLDLLENSATSLVIARYPAQTPLVDALAGVFTLLKWGLVFLSGALVIIGLLAVIVLFFRGRARKGA